MVPLAEIPCHASRHSGIHLATRTVGRGSFSPNPHHRLIRFTLFEIATLLAGQKDDPKDLMRLTDMLETQRQRRIRHERM